MANKEKINKIVGKLYEEDQNIIGILLATRNGLLEKTWPEMLYGDKETAKIVINFSSDILDNAMNIFFQKIFLTANNRRVGRIETGSLQEIILSGRYIQTVIIGTMSHLLFVYTNNKETNKALLQDIRGAAEKIIKVEVNETV